MMVLLDSKNLASLVALLVLFGTTLPPPPSNGKHKANKCVVSQWREIVSESLSEETFEEVVSFLSRALRAMLAVFDLDNDDIVLHENELLSRLKRFEETYEQKYIDVSTKSITEGRDLCGFPGSSNVPICRITNGKNIPAILERVACKLPYNLKGPLTQSCVRWKCLMLLTVELCKPENNDYEFRVMWR